MCPRLCGHDPTKFLMSTLYYHIIVKYFHIDDEMQFLNNTYHKTSWHLPIKKNPSKTKVHIYVDNRRNEKFETNHDKWMDKCMKKALPMYFLWHCLAPFRFKTYQSFLSYKCDFLVYHTTVIVNSVVLLKWIYMYIQWILCLTLKVSPYFFLKYLIIQYIF